VQLVRSIKQGAWQAREEKAEATKDTFTAKRRKLQAKIAAVYASTWFQVITSILIVTNFIITTTEVLLDLAQFATCST